jgi:hypothetical protein
MKEYKKKERKKERKKGYNGRSIQRQITHKEKEEKEKVVNGVKEKFRGSKNKASNIVASS